MNQPTKITIQSLPLELLMSHATAMHSFHYEGFYCRVDVGKLPSGEGHFATYIDNEFQGRWARLRATVALSLMKELAPDPATSHALSLQFSELLEAIHTNPRRNVGGQDE
jgi:hypothetical protein